MSVLNVVILSYVRPLEEIDAQLAAHAEWLDQGYRDGVFVASGRRIPRTGGVIVARGADMDALKARLQEDPLQRLGLAQAEIVAFEASRSAQALGDFLER